jgi:hypothetical protein
VLRTGDGSSAMISWATASISGDGEISNDLCGLSKICNKKKTNKGFSG